jgi:hypothetical protein
MNASNRVLTPLPTALAALALPAEDLEALTRQGFVAAEPRQRSGRLLGPFFKLRWRRSGRQRVCYLGKSPARADAVRAALEAIQRPLRLARQVARLLAEARKRLRQVKQALAPHLAANGLHLHGYAARRTSASAVAKEQNADKESYLVGPAGPLTEEISHGRDDRNDQHGRGQNSGTDPERPN